MPDFTLVRVCVCGCMTRHFIEVIFLPRRPARCRYFVLQADELSSSDDEQLSDSTATRGKQASEDFNVLDSFDLPTEARQDKVGYYQTESIFDFALLLLAVPECALVEPGRIIGFLTRPSLCRPGNITR